MRDRPRQRGGKTQRTQMAPSGPEPPAVGHTPSKRSAEPRTGTGFVGGTPNCGAVLGRTAMSHTLSEKDARSCLLTRIGPVLSRYR